MSRERYLLRAMIAGGGVQYGHGAAYRTYSFFYAQLCKKILVEVPYRVMDGVIILLEVSILLFIYSCSIPIDTSALKGGRNLESVS